MWYGPTKQSGKVLFKEPFAYIYLIYDEKYNKAYIGKRTCYSDPFRDGYTGSGVVISNIKNNITDGEFRQRFTKHVLEVLPGDFAVDCERSTVDSAERSWIAYYREEYGDDFLYNKTDGGDGGNTWNFMSDGQKNKVIEAVRRRHKGIKKSKETCEKISNRLKGRVFTKEHRKNLSESLKAPEKSKGENNPFYGKHHTEDTRKLISNKLKTLIHEGRSCRSGNLISLNKRFRDIVVRNAYSNAKKVSKGVVAIDKIDGSEIWFESISSAGRYIVGELDSSKCVGNIVSYITHCLRGDCKSTCGFYWRYEDISDEERSNMKRMNAYSMDIYNYNIEHGTDIFMEYKNENTTEERKKEIEDWLFNLMRSKGIVPVTILDDSAEQEDMIKLSGKRLEDSYDFETGDYKTNAVGVTFLNRFFGDLLCDVRKPGSPKTVKEGFHDDKMLRRVIKKSLSYTQDETGIIRWFYLASCGFCSNYRPASAKALYEIFGKKEGCRVLDTSAGYGSRLLAAHFAQNVTFYLGIDPNTCEKCLEEIEYLDRKYNTGTEKHVLKMGSEDFTPERFPNYKNFFDISFTSPPYFNTEMYADSETQSYKKFPTYSLWCKGFLQATIDNTCSALKSDGTFAINIFTKIPNIKKIIQLFLANNGFYVFREDKYLLKTMPGGKKNADGTVEVRKRDRYSNFEPVWYAKHYSQLLKEGLITEEQAKKYKERAIKDTHEVKI